MARRGAAEQYEQLAHAAGEVFAGLQGVGERTAQRWGHAVHPNHPQTTTSELPRPQALLQAAEPTFDANCTLLTAMGLGSQCGSGSGPSDSCWILTVSTAHKPKDMCSGALKHKASCPDVKWLSGTCAWEVSQCVSRQGLLCMLCSWVLQLRGIRPDSPHAASAAPPCPSPPPSTTRAAHRCTPACAPAAQTPTSTQRSRLAGVGCGAS
jgi:hypothetical protein